MHLSDIADAKAIVDYGVGRAAGEARARKYQNQFLHIGLELSQSGDAVVEFLALTDPVDSSFLKLSHQLPKRLGGREDFTFTNPDVAIWARQRDAHRFDTGVEIRDTLTREQSEAAVLEANYCGS